MNVIVTGCAGFIGSHTTEELLSRGYNVVGVDSLTYAASLENMKSFINNIDFYELDINDTEEIRTLVQDNNIEWIINFAAETHVDNSIISVDPFIHSNISGVSSLLEVCRKTGCKFLQISTDEVYGSTADGSFIETDNFNPRNPYSATKTAAEHLVTSFHNTHGVEYKMTRMSNNFGPRQHQEKFIPTILRSIKNGKKIPIYGDGKNIRDWFYVKDCSRCVVDVLENGKVNEVYNLTLQNELENIEVVNLILEHYNLNMSDHIEFVDDRLGHDFRYSINNEKFLSLTNITATDFKESLRQTILEE
tara:strand:- start:7572 stop:8486 length:915 start_codon:yes stop_codon:yes gene_type:complete